MKRLIAALTVVLLLSVVVGNAWGAVQYTVTDLGTLPGCTTSAASGINASGQIVGRASVSGGYPTYAFLYGNGVMADLSALHGILSCANGINDSGQVVGYARLGGSSNHAFLYSNGTLTDMGAPFGGPSSFALGINASGIVVGDAYSSSSYSPRAFPV